MENWEKIRAVQKMQDYILQNISEPITLLQLSRTADYSPWHSARIFKELTGKTPFEYIREVRLSQAAMALRDEQAKIIDVAFDFVFDSHEGFTRAFSKQFGLTPREYRRDFPPITLFMPYRVSDYYKILQKGEDTMKENPKTSTVFVQVVERPRRKAIIKRGIKASHYFEYCEEVGCDIWGILTSIKDALYEPIGMWLPPSMIKPGTSSYVQGVEVPDDYKGSVPEGFEVIIMEPCKMMVFQGQPYEEGDFQQAIEELWQTMKKYDPKIYGFEWADDDAPRFQLAPMAYRGYIEARPVKQVNIKQ